MSLEDAMERFRSSAKKAGFSLKIGLDTNLKPTSIGIGPFEVQIGRKKDEDSDPGEEMKKQEKEPGIKDWQKRELRAWKTWTFWSYWKDAYQDAFKFPYQEFDKKEFVQLSKLWKQFGPAILKEMMDFTLKNASTIRQLHGRPTLSFLYGFRDTLVNLTMDRDVKDSKVTIEERPPEDVNKW